MIEKERQKNQMNYCSECIHLVDGYTHTFDHGMLQTCTKGEFREMNDCTLANRIPFCTSPVKEFKFPYCRECMDGHSRYYSNITCLHCFDVTKSCITCQHCDGFKNQLCLLHGKLSQRRLNGWGLKEKAAECKEYAEKTKPFELPVSC